MSTRVFHGSLRRAFLLMALMFTAAILAYFLTPRTMVRAEAIDLEDLIPRQFDGWYMDERTTLGIINPVMKETLTKTYSQTLSRTYINRDGHRIMLSLAYGADQSSKNLVHRPELCYPAQGFSILNQKRDVIHVAGRDLPVMRLVTEAGSRHEPLTYWIRFGDKMVRGATEPSLARVLYGLQGIIPDGLLFRVSEINRDAQQSFILQDEFINSLLNNLTPEAKKAMIGSPVPL